MGAQAVLEDSTDEKDSSEMKEKVTKYGEVESTVESNKQSHSVDEKAPSDVPTTTRTTTNYNTSENPHSPHASSSEVTPSTNDNEPGDITCAEQLVNEDDTINFDVPCFAWMKDTPCWDQFKTAFSCVHYSKAETPAAECMGELSEMVNCTSQYPELYSLNDEEKEEDGGSEEDQIETKVEDSPDEKKE